MDEPFSNAWHVTKSLNRCPLATGAVGQYFNKAAFTSIDRSHLGGSVSGGGGSECDNSLAERSFAHFRTNARGQDSLALSGVERFDGSMERAPPVFAPPTRASAVSMARATFIPGGADVDQFL